MRIYYLSTPETPGRHRILAAIWDTHLPGFDDSTMTANKLTFDIDEDPANLPHLRTLVALLSRSTRPGQPPPPRYRVAPPGQLERPDGTLWTPATNPDRTALFAPLPGSVGVLAFLDQILNDGGATVREKQMARIVRRLVRRARQQNGGGPDD